MRRDYATTFLTEGLVITTYLLALRLVAEQLGATGFGEYSLSRRALSLLLPIGVMGVDISITRYVSYAAAERSDRTASYAPAGLILAAGATAILSLILILLNRFWAQVFFGSEAFSSLVLAIPPLLVGGVLHSVAYGYLRGLARIQRANLLMAVNHAIVPLVAILLFGGSISSILTAMGLGWTFVSVVALVRLPMHIANLRSRMWQLVRYGVPRVPGDLVTLSLFAMPGILVVHAADIRVAGIVAFGVAAVSMIGSGLTPVSFVLLPVAARMFASGSVQKLRAQVFEVAGVTLAGSAVLIVAVEIFAGPIVSAYLGPSFAGGVPILRLSLLGALPWGLYVTLRSVVDARHVFPVNTRNLLISFASSLVGLAVFRQVFEPTIAPVLAFVVATYVMGLLTVFEVYRITGKGRYEQIPPVVESDVALS